MLNQLIEQGMDFTSANEMIVIQHQHEIVRQIGQIIDEERDDILD